jgi:hypothetical protein
MNNKNKYILFYSNQCQHCEEFTKRLYKSNYFNEFVRICIDDPKIKNQIPSNITTVPTIILPTKPRKQLEGQQVFTWFNSMNKGAKEENTDIQAFSSDMGNLSDNFSFIGNDAPQEHSFSFLGKHDNKITTPQETEAGSSSKAKDPSSASYERLLEQRNREMPKTDRV